jgi:hypothetical protein
MFFLVVMPFASMRNLFGELERRQVTNQPASLVSPADHVPLGQRPLLENSYMQQSSEYLEYTDQLLQSILHGKGVVHLDDMPTQNDMLKLQAAFSTGNITSISPVGGNDHAAMTRYWLHRGCLPALPSAMAFMGQEPPRVPRRRVMLVCGMHGRELITSDFCRIWLLQAAASYLRSSDCQDKTQQPSRSIAPIDWLFVPVANAQGRDLVARARKEWQFTAVRDRQHQDYSQMCHRGNLFGVDLNRNWPTPHKRPEDVHLGDEEYPGPSAFSEPETMNLHRMLSHFQPDVLLAVHSGEFAILTPYDDGEDEAPLEARSLLLKMANWMAALSRCKTMRCLVGNGAAHLGRSYGTMGDFAYRNGLASFPFTLEIYGGKTNWTTPEQCFSLFNPADSEAAIQRWGGLWRGWYYMTERDQTYLQQMLMQMENL